MRSCLPSQLHLHLSLLAADPSADWVLPILMPLVLLALMVMLHSNTVLMKWLVASTKAKSSLLGASIAAASANYSSVILTLSSFGFAVSTISNQLSANSTS